MDDPRMCPAGNRVACTPPVSRTRSRSRRVRTGAGWPPRRRCRTAAGPAGASTTALVRPPGVLLLEVCAVAQHDRGQVGGVAGADDATVEAVDDEPRQVAAVVEVGVRQQHGVEGWHASSGNGSQLRRRSSARPW